MLFEIAYYYPAREYLAIALYRAPHPYYPEARVRDLFMQTQFSLLRLETAAKLYALESRRRRPSLPDLVPAYLRTLPPDLFEAERGPSGPIKLTDATTTTTHFYSVGPDGKDQKGALQYDPTNGSFSAGDVMLAR